MEGITSIPQLLCNADWKDYNEFFEKTLNQGQWTEDGGTKHWVLVLRSDYDGEICSGARVYVDAPLCQER